MAIPLLIAAGIAAAATAASAGGGAAAGVGKDTTRSPNFGESGLYDPNKFKYGGTPGGANEAAARYQAMAAAAQGRGGDGLAMRANQWDGAAGQQFNNAEFARQGQQQSADMMQRRAMGLMPSIAQMQADRQMQQAAAAQASQAASARGAGGLALAQQNAANNVAGAQGAISGQAQINAANEQLQNAQAANNAYGVMRQGDTTAQNAAGQMYQAAGQRAYQQNELNDRMTLGMGTLEQGVRSNELQGGIADQRTLAGSSDLQGQQHAAEGQANANRQMDWFRMGIGGLQGASSMMGAGGGGARAAGGPVKKGGLYLVGERGPELMVAPSDGHIIPNHALMAGAAQAAGRNGLSGMGARDMQQMLDDRSAPAPTPAVTFDPYRNPYTTEASLQKPASPEEQTRFENALIAGPPSKLDQSNQREADKIRANFGQGPSAAQEQWNKQYGSSTLDGASAGARDAPQDGQLSVGQAIMMGLLGGGRRAA